MKVYKFRRLCVYINTHLQKHNGSSCHDLMNLMIKKDFLNKIRLMKDKVNEFRYIKNKILFFSTQRSSTVQELGPHT